LLIKDWRSRERQQGLRKFKLLRRRMKRKLRRFKRKKYKKDKSKI
jgi:hypothetical protein